MAGSEKSVDLTQKGRPPTSEEVENFHTYADTDTRSESVHHTLGPTTTQASSGSHRHRGGDSVPLLDGLSITGSRGGNVALLSVIQCLVALGASDQSTA